MGLAAAADLVTTEVLGAMALVGDVAGLVAVFLGGTEVLGAIALVGDVKGLVAVLPAAGLTDVAVGGLPDSAAGLVGAAGVTVGDLAGGAWIGFAAGGLTTQQISFESSVSEVIWV